MKKTCLFFVDHINKIIHILFWLYQFTDTNSFLVTTFETHTILRFLRKSVFLFLFSISEGKKHGTVTSEHAYTERKVLETGK